MDTAPVKTTRGPAGPLAIGIVTETYPPEVNGVAITLASLAQTLVSQGHRVSVVRPHRSDLDGAATPGIDIATVPGAPLPRYPDLRFGWPAVGRLQALWRDQRPDVLYIATEGPLGWAAARAARALGIPATSGYHTRFDEYAGHYGLKFAQPLIRRYLRRFHNRTRATVVPTENLQRQLTQEGYANVRVLPRGVDTRRFTPGKRDDGLRRQWGAGCDTPVAVCVGRIAPEKNIDLAVRAFGAFRDAAGSARFVWVGDGPGRAAIEKQQPDYIFTGTLKGDDLARHYASADVFLFPSLTETYGNVTLEALASGLAVVAFNYGAARAHISAGQSGCLAREGDEAQFINLATQLGKDPVLRARLQSGAPSAVAELSLQRVARHFAATMSIYVDMEVPE